MNTDRRVLIALFVAAIFFSLINERIPFNQGLGMDGIHYARWVMILPDLLKSHELEKYYIGRIVPSATVRALMKVVSAPLVPEAIIRYFSYLNFILWIASAYLLWLCGGKIGLSNRARYLVLMLAFLNYGLANHAFYYPVLTDVSALFLSTLSLYCYLEKKNIGLYITAIIGAFTWPTLLLTSLILTLFDGDLPKPSNEKKTPWLCVAAGMVSLLALSLPVYGIIRDGTVTEYLNLRHINNPPEVSHFSWLGYFLVLTLVSVPISLLFRHRSLDEILSRLIPNRLFIAAAVFLACRVVTLSLSAPTGSLDQWELFKVVVLRSACLPGLPLVAHFTYFGAITCLLVFYFREFTEMVDGAGPGPLLIVALGFLLLADPESRHATTFIPFFSLYLGAAMEKRGASRAIFLEVTAIGLITSKLWLRINGAMWSENGPRISGWFEFPAQYYMMNHGLWISPRMLVIQGAILVFFLLITALVVPRRA